jgi:preprotein translocase subunit SecA
MRAWWRSMLAGRTEAPSEIREVKRLRDDYARLDDGALHMIRAQAASLPEIVAATAVAAFGATGLQMFDAQLEGALAMGNGKSIEMQTGEGKTLAAVPAVVWHARSGRGVHVLTANDYLAKRDAAWMGDIYSRLGLSVASIHQDMTREARHAAYSCDVTYATPTRSASTISATSSPSTRKNKYCARSRPR